MTQRKWMLSAEQRVVCVNPMHLKITGCLNSAHLLGQMIDLDKVYKGAEFCKTDQELIDQLRIGLRPFKAAKANLKHLGIITIVLMGIPPKTYYKLNREALKNLAEAERSKGELQ